MCICAQMTGKYNGMQTYIRLVDIRSKMIQALMTIFTDSWQSRFHTFHCIMNVDLN